MSDARVHADAVSAPQELTGTAGPAPEPVRLPRLGPVGWGRWAWRTLTSRRAALLLLLLLALAALPGSIWPQRSINPTRTADYIAAHPSLGPVLDRLGFFEVYATPWFSAIYLLLLISLVGCVLPRTRIHLRQVRARPPRVPANLSRLPAYHALDLDLDPPEAIAAVRTALGRRYRVDVRDGDCLAAETGYAKETGNLLFHLALIGVIVGVAIGHVWGWKGDVIVPVGSTFSNTAINYDTINPGPRADPSRLPPFSLTLDRFDASFEDRITSAGQFGAPRDFTAYLSTTQEPGAAPRQRILKVNQPVEMDGATVFLLGNGYAADVTVKDARGVIVYDGPTVFLPRDNNYTSPGAIKVPGARPQGLGFFGNLLPTAVITDDQGPISVFPDARDPALALGLYEGELFPGGASGSVYALNTQEMTQVTGDDGDVLRIWLEPGQTVDLPGERGSITLNSIERWAGLSIRHDPAKNLTLAASLLALGGLIASLLIRRRRVFARAIALPGGGSRLELGGLAKGEDSGLADHLAALAGRAGSVGLGSTRFN